MNNEIIRQKLLDMINDLENKSYEAKTIVEAIKNNLKFNKFEDEQRIKKDKKRD